MGEYNKIELVKAESSYTRANFKNYSKGDLILGDDTMYEGILKWDISQKEEAEKALAEVRCRIVEGPELYYITEYALQYFEEDEDSNFIQGCDYDFADWEETEQ